jgi:phosphatidylglycerol:prolipoprotein diacylglycerol transferase
VQPVLFTLFGIPISAFGVFLLAAFFVAITMARREARASLGLDPNQVLDLSLYAIIAGIVTGRFGFILVNLNQFLTDPAKMLTIWRDGGLVFYGALVGGLWLARTFAARWKVSFGALVDAYAPGLIAGYGIAMVGALLHGLFAGKPTGVPWAVDLFLERRHPVQVYLMVAAAGILLILRAQRRQQLAAGTLFVLALFLQAVARFVVDVFVDAPAVVGPLTAGQLASAAVALITLAMLIRLQRLAPAAVTESPAEVPA